MADIKLMLAERGMSVAAFARLAGVPQPTMHRIANGEASLAGITASTLMKVAHALGLSAEELYYDDPRYLDDKSEIDAVYAMTSAEGRRAMLANARGVREAYPSRDGSFLPDIREELPDFSIV